jgi:hypothetical protein
MDPVRVDGARFLICKFPDADYFKLAFSISTDFQLVKIHYASLAPYIYEIKTPDTPAATKEQAWLDSGCGFDRMDKRPFVKVRGPENLWVPLDTHLVLDFM